MASEDDHITTVYNDDEDEDENDDDLKDEDIVPGDSSDSDETNSTSSAAALPALPLSSSSSAVSIALLPPPPPSSSSAIVAMPAPKPPFDDSRKLFQKLWTDEDEIQLLTGFLQYNTHRGPNWSGHHHDTTAFYDQIKSKIQLDCNKNQVVEKLRRLKKKYRTLITRITSGKDSVFKSPHDHTLFEISAKIWGNSIASRPEFDDDDQNPNPTLVATPHSAAPTGFSIDINTPGPDKMLMMNMGMPNKSRKRSRMQPEETSSINLNAFEPLNAAQESVEDTIRSCFKEFIANITTATDFGSSGLKGIGSLVSNAVPMNFPEVNLGNVMDERWRKQLILELQVYSKRLELVQDQIKLSLENLRSRGS